MVKKLTKHGNSYALVIDRPILDLLRITPDTPLELTSDGGAFWFPPCAPGRQEKLRASLEKINRKFGADLRRLAE